MSALSPVFWIKACAPLLAHVERDYRWGIPGNVPVAFQQTGDAFADNLTLRHALHAAWRTTPGRRDEIAEWFVGDWGRVRRNHPQTIAHYVQNVTGGGLNRLRGVSSWSKVAVLADPDRNAIYDARVAFALNALQFAEHGHVVEEFPIPLGRNAEIERVIPTLRLPRVRYATGREPYDRYLEILQLLRLLGSSIQESEMALFAASERLARQIG